MLIVFFFFLFCFFCCFFFFCYLNLLAIWVLNFECLYFARIYFRWSLISHFFFNREKREIMYTNKKYSKADSCFCLSMRSTHIPREIRVLTKLFQCHSKGPLLHSKKIVISSKTQNDYIFNEQILGQFGEIGFRKINKQKNT